MKFVSIDVETANPDVSSICAIGVAAFEGEAQVEEWYTLVDPEDYFDPYNVLIHGIDECIVEGAPKFGDICSELFSFMAGNVVVTHTPFDRAALAQAAMRRNVDLPSCTWLDSARVVRRTWDECARRGYGLAAVCERIGYKFKHHHALEDAKAAGHVLLAAMKASNLDLAGIIERSSQPINLSVAAGGKIRRDGNPDGPLFGEVVVFTGALSIPRREAADIAASLGCEVAPAVTKRTTILVVGDTDVRQLAGHSKSAKHRKAEQLISKGQEIRILRETDFMRLLQI